MSDKDIRRVSEQWKREIESATTETRRLYQLHVQKKNGQCLERYKSAWVERRRVVRVDMKVWFENWMTILYRIK